MNFYWSIVNWGIEQIIIIVYAYSNLNTITKGLVVKRGFQIARLNRSCWWNCNMKKGKYAPLINENMSATVLYIACLLYIYTPTHWLLPVLPLTPIFCSIYTTKDEGWSKDERSIIEGWSEYHRSILPTGWAQGTLKVGTTIRQPWGKYWGTTSEPGRKEGFSTLFYLPDG